jgi:ATP synthase protein I
VNDRENKKLSADGKPLTERIGSSELRKMKARKQAVRSIWSGFAMFGTVGWSIVIPTLLGVAIGLWLDSNYPSGKSWTLMLMIVGLFIGCLNAWHWIAEENRNMHKED